MIKKIMAFTLMLLSLGLMMYPSIKAEVIFVNEPAANMGGLWHIEDGNRAYVNMRYDIGGTVVETGSITNDNYPTYDYSKHTYIEMGSELDFNFSNTDTLKTATINNPDPNLYKSFTVEIVANMMTISGDEPTVKIIESYTDTNIINQIKIDLHDWADRPTAGDAYDYIYDYSYIDIFADNTKILTSRNISENTPTDFGYEVNPLIADMAFGVRMYWEKAETATIIDPAIEGAWDVLPTTAGNPTSPIGDWGSVSNINVIDNTVSFDILYTGTTYPVAAFTVDGNLDFINKANDVLYYSDPTTNDKMLYFNFGSTLESAILTATTFNDVNEWKGEALWNLTTSEIKVTDVLKVYNYIPEIDSDGNVYSYFYMPDVVIDSLISVSALLAYRYWDNGFLGLSDSQPGETQYKNVSAVRGETSSTNPTWVERTYKTAYITSAMTSVATVAGIVPGYGWAVAGAAFLVGATLNVADVNEWFAYDVNQIEHVIPSISLANDINNYITETGGSDSFDTSTDKLYKIHLATLQDGDDVEIMEASSNITQVVWETNGQIYVVNAENIDDPSWGGPGTETPDLNDVNIETIFYVGLGVVGVVLFSKLKLDKKPGLLIIIILAAAYMIYKLGMI